MNENLYRLIPPADRFQIINGQVKARKPHLKPSSEDERLIDWLIGMLLVSMFGLVEEDAVEVFHYYGFLLFCYFLM